MTWNVSKIAKVPLPSKTMIDSPLPRCELGQSPLFRSDKDPDLHTISADPSRNLQSRSLQLGDQPPKAFLDLSFGFGSTLSPGFLTTGSRIRL